jgi:TRAP-type C4-dicarboxylate transport system permease small subunit
MLRKAYDKLFKIINAISITLVIAMVSIVSYMVVMRYIFSNSPRWGDELALLCMIWIAFFSASTAMKEDLHIRIKLWDLVLPPKAMKVLEVIVHLIVCAVLLVLIKYGVDLVELSASNVLPGSRLPMMLLYIVEPITGVFMIIAAIGRIGEIIGS